jgi:Protein of unknown function (DUF2924)
MTTFPYPFLRTSSSAVGDLDAELARLATLNVEELRALWRDRSGRRAPDALSKDLLGRALAHRLQEERLGGLDRRVSKLLGSSTSRAGPPVRHLKIGSVIVREHRGELHEVMVVPGGFCWRRQVYASLSTIARKITGVSWNGPRFFGLRGKDQQAQADPGAKPHVAKQQIAMQTGGRSGQGAVRPGSSMGAPNAGEGAA